MFSKVLYLFTILSIASFAYGQNPYINFDFNNCQIQDLGQNNYAVEVGGSPSCGCGLEGDALYFDGVDDYVAIDQNLNGIFDEDFTLSFYVKIENDPFLSKSVDLFSYQNDCERDSSFTLKYIPTIRECRLDIVKSLSKSTQINFTLDEGKCWQHIVIVRDHFDFLVYLNGRLLTTESVSTDYYFKPDARFAISDGPCLGTNSSEIRFKGAFENIVIYNKALNEIEIHDLDMAADEIINRDTTLLLGESLQIQTGPSCADNFLWDNTSDFDDPTSLNPLITPEESGLYTLYFQNDGCTSVDSIAIYIQNPDDLECDKLLLPNAFTPNGDDLNEVFEISNKFIVDEIISFDIYNRLGTRVFHSDNKLSAWDGTYQGTLLNPAKFAYVIEYVCQGEQYKKRGIVSLIR